MSNRKLTYRGFCQFVRLQPQGKKIQHETWCGCAVGEYVLASEQDSQNWALSHLPYTLWMILCNVGDATNAAPTYGHLHALINSDGIRR